MPPSPGVRPDLATRLRQSQRALKSRLGKPETQLALIRASHETLDPGVIGDLIVEHATAWLDVETCVVVAENHQGQVTRVGSLAIEADVARVAVAIGRWILGRGGTFASAELRRDDRIRGDFGAVLALPLRCRRQVVGALVVIDAAAAAGTPKLDRETGELVAGMLEGPTVALDNALRLERAEALSVTDDLTQLYNSRYLNLVLRRESKRASRSGRPLSLLFVDLDGFKHVNDNHGHLAGGKALVEAARVLKGSARETDIVARFGGDEFALVLPDTGSEGAVAVAERVRERVAAQRFLRDEGLNIALTVSIGVATLPDVAASAEELVRAADAAMYQVKDAGKNGVNVARGDQAAE